MALTTRTSSPAETDNASKLNSTLPEPPPLFATPTLKILKSLISSSALKCNAFPVTPPEGISKSNTPCKLKAAVLTNS